LLEVIDDVLGHAEADGGHGTISVEAPGGAVTHSFHRLHGSFRGFGVEEVYPVRIGRSSRRLDNPPFTMKP
jgi:hypothetical protein